MRRLLTGLMLIMVFSACHRDTASTSEKSRPVTTSDSENNLLAIISEQDLKGFRWLNRPEQLILAEGTLKVMTKKGSDFFNNPVDGSVTATAPLFYKEIQGDFVATAQVKPDHASIWNAASLMVHIDSLNWLKLAFENSDATGPTIVSVVTRGSSDDANGPVLQEQETVWLRIIRKNDVYAMHWSINGEEYRMVRLSSLPFTRVVKIGLEAQCPVGYRASHEFLFFSIETRTINNLRTGE